MNAKFYFLHLEPKGGVTVNDERILKLLNKALNWIHLPPYTWILYSTTSPDEWYNRFKKYVQPGGHLFICELDVTPARRHAPRRVRRCRLFGQLSVSD